MIKKYLQFGFLSLLIFALAGCGGNKEEAYRVDLEIWGTFDDTDAYQEIFSAYKEINPHVRNITYRKLPVESYRQDLLEALAAGNGPDIFLVRNSWMSDFSDKMVPAPEGMIPEKNYRENFPDVAAGDFLSGDAEVYAVPLSVDSLALYYNKDIFNAAGVARPPVTWEEVDQLVPRLTRIDSFGNITQSAIALGTADNINRSTDILTALLYQKGSNITRTTGNPDLTDQQSQEALKYYLQFGDIRSPLYTWNQSLHYSLDAFYEGNLAMMVNYSWQYPVLKQKNAKLNIGVAPLPQFASGVTANQANYWGYGVAKNKAYNSSSNDAQYPSEASYTKLRTFEAWQFLKFMAFAKEKQTMRFQNGVTGTTADIMIPVDPSKMYLTKTGKPGARRDIIAEQQNDPTLASFASGNLLAKNWISGNVDAIEGVLAELIKTVATGNAPVNEALGVATRRINTLLQE